MQSTDLDARRILRGALLVAAVAVPLALGGSPAPGPPRIKELLLCLAGVAALATLDGRRLLAWSTAAALLWLSARRAPDAALATFSTLSILSLLALGLAAFARVSFEDLRPALRGQSAVLAILGVDALATALGASPLAAVRPRGDFLLPGADGVVRAGSFLQNPNHLAAFAVAAGFAAWAGRRLDPAARRLHEAGALGALAALLFSYSRGGVIAALAGAGVLALRDRPARRRVLLGAAVLLLLSLPRLATLFEPSSPQLENRLAILAGGLAALGARPIFGWGQGGFSSAYSVHAPASWWRLAPPEEMTLDAHGDLLDWAVGHGLAGILFLAAAILFAAPRLGARWRRRDPAAPALEAALVGAGAAGLFASVLAGPSAGPPSLLAALLLTADEPQESENAPRRVSRSRAAAAGLLFFSLLPPFLSDAAFREGLLSYLHGGDPEETNVRLRLARRLAPGDPAPRFLDGARNLPDAYDDLSALARSHPGYRDVEWILARAARAGGRRLESRAWLSRSLTLRPSGDRSLVLAIWEAEDGLLDSARGRLQETARALPERAEPPRLLGSLARMRGEPDAAVRYFDAALARSNDARDAAQLRRAMGLPPAGEPVFRFERVASTDPVTGSGTAADVWGDAEAWIVLRASGEAPAGTRLRVTRGGIVDERTLSETLAAGGVVRIPAGFEGVATVREATRLRRAYFEAETGISVNVRRPRRMLARAAATDDVSEAALDIARWAIRMTPEDTHARLLLARHRAREGRHDASRIHYQILAATGSRAQRAEAIRVLGAEPPAVDGIDFDGIFRGVETAAETGSARLRLRVERPLREEYHVWIGRGAEPDRLVWRMVRAIPPSTPPGSFLTARESFRPPAEPGTWVGFSIYPAREAPWSLWNDLEVGVPVRNRPADHFHNILVRVESSP